MIYFDSQSLPVLETIHILHILIKSNVQEDEPTVVVYVDVIYAMMGKGPFKYYVIKEVGGWGQIMAIFDKKKSKT